MLSENLVVYPTILQPLHAETFTDQPHLRYSPWHSRAFRRAAPANRFGLHCSPLHIPVSLRRAFPLPASGRESHLEYARSVGARLPLKGEVDMRKHVGWEFLSTAGSPLTLPFQGEGPRSTVREPKCDSLAASGERQEALSPARVPCPKGCVGRCPQRSDPQKACARRENEINISLCPFGHEWASRGE